MIRHRLVLCRLAVAASLASTAGPVWARDVKGWDHASSYARDALVLLALGLPAAKGDWTGDLQAGESMGAAFLVTGGLKELIPEWRPDHSDRRGFPSGHSSSAFAAAATLQNRYGWQVGLPAQALASFVAVSRVEARKHRWHDVLAGAAIGEASGFLLTSRHNASVQVLPWGDAHGAGLALSGRF